MSRGNFGRGIAPVALRAPYAIPRVTGRPRLLRRNCPVRGVTFLAPKRGGARLVTGNTRDMFDFA